MAPVRALDQRLTRLPSCGVMAALDALRAAGIAPSVNLKLFFEGEEEAGSPHLEAMLARHAERLKADVSGLLRRSRPPEPAAAAVLGRARRDGSRDDGLRGDGAAAQRPLRQLGAESRGDPPIVRYQRSSCGEPTAASTIAGFYDDVRPPSDTERAARAGSRRGPGAARRARAGGDGAGPARGGSCCPRSTCADLLSGQVRRQGRQRDPHRGHRLDRFPDGAGPGRPRRCVHVSKRISPRRDGTSFTKRPTAAVRRSHARLVRLDWAAGYPPSRSR